MAKNAVATKQSTEVALPSYIKRGNEGKEHVTARDLIIPRIDLVQALSKARVRGDPNFIEGAVEGDLYNSVTRQLYGQSVMVVPLLYRPDYAVWKDRKSATGGGFRGVFASQAEAEAKKNELHEDDLAVVFTPTMFVVVMHENGTTEDAVITMPRTKEKVAKRWITLTQYIPAPLYAKPWRVASIQDKNAKGDIYYNLAVEPVEGWTPETLFVKCEARYKELFAGRPIAHVGDDTEE